MSISDYNKSAILFLISLYCQTDDIIYKKEICEMILSFQSFYSNIVFINIIKSYVDQNTIVEYYDNLNDFIEFIDESEIFGFIDYDYYNIVEILDVINKVNLRYYG